MHVAGRSMDWGEDMLSKYGSLIVTAYDIGTAEGMNGKGLVVNELALVE